MLKVILSIPAMCKILFWMYIFIAGFGQFWADYFTLQNSYRVIFYICYGGCALFLIFGAMHPNKSTKLSKICATGVVGTLGSFFAAFWYLETKELAVLNCLWGALVAITLYWILRKNDHRNHYFMLFMLTSLGTGIGYGIYYFFYIVGAIPICGAMGFCITAFYFFDEEPERKSLSEQFLW